MEQKQVKIIGFRAEKYNIIKSVVLTPDIMQKQLILLTADSGNGKSTLLELLQTAVSGTDAIKKKDILENGYLSEVQLLDGDIKLYAGARVRETARGANKGEPVFETFLYAKDANGKEYQPIIDGVQATASSYIKMLTTELTFNMPSFFSENQTQHSKLIEGLFKNELQLLGVEKIQDEIKEKRSSRDAARNICEANGAFKEHFEQEGYSEEMLASLQSIDIARIDADITSAKIEKDRLVNGTETSYQLAIERLDNERKTELQKIKDDGANARRLLDEDKLKKQTEYDSKYREFLTLSRRTEDFLEAQKSISESFYGVVEESEINKLKEVIKSVERYSRTCPVLEEPDASLQKAYDDKLKEYQTLENTPIQYPSKTEIDTTEIDKKIQQLESKKKAAESNNAVVSRFNMWQNWMGKKAEFEKVSDTLKSMYAKVDTGVKGLFIVPNTTDSGKTEIWMQYDGCYDKDFFQNTTGELRFIFQYSSFQRSIIGIMLQAARLNLKPKALRLAIIDDVAFNSKGLSVLSQICEDLNVQLITSRTIDYDKNNIADGEIIIEGGEVFFNK